MGFDPKRNAAEWLYGSFYKDEAIRPKALQPQEKLPSMLRTARSLENKPGNHWQSRESVFLKQAKLLVSYEDDYAFSANVVRYYPTYESLTDQELRGYFSWRTKYRRGNVQKTSLSFVFLYIYELINQIGIHSPEVGYEKLLSLRDTYGTIDGSILSYLDRWMVHYVVYYGLDQRLLEQLPRVRFDRCISLLEHIEEHSTPEIVDALTTLSPKWLGRSKFYASNKSDMDTVIARVMKRIVRHYNNCKRGFGEQFFGPLGTYEVRLFDTAIFSILWIAGFMNTSWMIAVCTGAETDTGLLLNTVCRPNPIPSWEIFSRPLTPYSGRPQATVTRSDRRLIRSGS